MASLHHLAGAAMLAGALFAAGGAAAQQALTIEQNMAEQRRAHIIPGRTLHVENARGYTFCEVAPIVGTSPANAVANFYNPTGVSHCSPEQFAQLDAAAITRETGALQTFLNPSRQWTFDEFRVFEVGEERQFGSVSMVWMAAVPAEVMRTSVGAAHYHPGQIYRHNSFIFKAGRPVFLLDTPDGKVLVMQSFSNHVNRELTMETLGNLGSQFRQLPPGWRFRTRVLDRDLTIAPPEPNRLAWVTQDEFLNSYQGCGYDAACNYVP